MNICDVRVFGPEVADEGARAVGSLTGSSLMRASTYSVQTWVAGDAELTDEAGYHWKNLARRRSLR